MDLWLNHLFCFSILMLLLFFWHFSYVFMRYKGFCVWEKLKRILKIELFINAMLYHLFFENNSECNQIKISLNANAILKCTKNCLKQGIVQCRSMQNGLSAIFLLIWTLISINTFNSSLKLGIFSKLNIMLHQAHHPN